MTGMGEAGYDAVHVRDYGLLPHCPTSPFEVPQPSEVAGDPLGALRAWPQSDGLSLHAATPGWLGGRLDVGYAIDVLHPLAR